MSYVKCDEVVSAVADEEGDGGHIVAMPGKARWEQNDGSAFPRTRRNVQLLDTVLSIPTAAPTGAECQRGTGLATTSGHA